MVPAARAVVISSFAVRERGRALAIFFGVSGAFTAVGPIAGGYLTQWTWRAIFWVNFPVAAAALILLAWPTWRTPPPASASTGAAPPWSPSAWACRCWASSSGQAVRTDFATATSWVLWGMALALAVSLVLALFHPGDQVGTEEPDEPDEPVDGVTPPVEPAEPVEPV